MRHFRANVRLVKDLVVRAVGGFVVGHQSGHWQSEISGKYQI